MAYDLRERLVEELGQDVVDDIDRKTPDKIDNLLAGLKVKLEESEDSEAEAIIRQMLKDKVGYEGGGFVDYILDGIKAENEDFDPYDEGEEVEYLEDTEEELQEMFFSAMTEDVEGQLSANAVHYAPTTHFDKKNDKKIGRPIATALDEEGFSEDESLVLLESLNMSVLEKVRDRLHIDAVMRGPVGVTREGKGIRALSQKIGPEIDADEFFGLMRDEKFDELAEDIADHMADALGEIEALYPYVLVMPCGPFYLDGEAEPIIGFVTRYSRA